MSTFSSLEIAKRGLIAQQYGISITSNNTTNVDTAGYTKQNVIISETDPDSTSGGNVGTGAVATTLLNARDEFADDQIRNNDSKLSAYTADSSVLTSVETYLNEPSDTGLTELTTSFFNSIEDAAQQPDSVSLRQNVISEAQTLTDKFNSITQNLSDTRDTIKTTASSNIDSANSLISQIVTLNKSIADSYSKTGAVDSTYSDQRETAIESLSKIMDIKVTNGTAGVVNIASNGINLITGATGSTLKLNETIDSTTGERTLQIQRLDEKGTVTSTVTPQAGELGSELKSYNVLLDDKDTSNGFSIAKQLDIYASTLSKAVNSISETGYGLDDTGTTAPGTDIFTSKTGTITASTISVNSDIVNDARKIPLSDTAGVSGNSNIALKLSDIAEDSTFLNNMTPSEYYSGVLGKLGNLSSDAKTGVSTTTTVSDNLTTQRDSTTGVSLDEEATNLIKFQKAYEASANVMSKINDLLDVLVNLGN